MRVDLELRSATVTGDRALLESLVRNLVDNACRHNRPDGWVRIVVESSADAGRVVLDVSNSAVDDAGHAGCTPGTPHIGLSIVTAVLDAHDGTIEWRRGAGAVTAHVELPATAGVARLSGGVSTIG